MRLSIILVLLLLSGFIPTVQALVPPNVEFIPSRFSAGASFIAVAEGDLSTSIRISWTVPGPGVIGGVGLFPRIGDKFMCYFSASDPQSTCGPSPFALSTVGTINYTMEVRARDSAGVTANVSVGVAVGGITLDTDVNVENNTVFMIVFPSAITSSVSYRVYYLNATPVTSGFTNLNKNIQTGAYLGNVNLTGGNYFIAFSASAPNNNFGGTLAKVSLPVSGGTVSCSLPPAGGTQGGLPLVAEEVYLPDILINPGHTYRKRGFEITNLGNQTYTGVTVSVPSNLTQLLNVSLGSATFAVNDTNFFAVELRNIQEATSINTVVDVRSGSQLIGQIPVRMLVSVIGGTTPTCPGSGGLAIEPGVWTGDYLVGTAASKPFTIANNGGAAISGITSTQTGNLGTVSATFPPSIDPGASGTADVSLNPDSAGSYQGTITIQTSEGSAAILVNVNFFEDISSQISSLRSDFDDFELSLDADQKIQWESVLSAIDGGITDANSRFSSGEYREAQEQFLNAQAKYSVLKDASLPTGPLPPEPPPVPNGGGVDITLVLIILVVIGGGAIAFLFMRKRKAEKPLDEELDEEFEQMKKL